MRESRLGSQVNDYIYLNKEQGSILLALVAAGNAGHWQEIPVGAVLRDEAGRFLAEGGNKTLTIDDPTGHAEMHVLRQGAARLGNYRLPGTTLTVTLEPCAMCSAAIAMARIKQVLFEVKSPLLLDEENLSIIQFVNSNLSHIATELQAGSAQLLRIFFDDKRKI